MHNLIPFNQLTVGQENTDKDLITEYYECLIECSEKQNVIAISNYDKRYSIKLLLHNHLMLYRAPIATLAAAIVSLS